jgi:hypothetical protein
MNPQVTYDATVLKRYRQQVRDSGPSIPAGRLNDMRLFRGGRGIYADADITRGVLGVMVLGERLSLLNGPLKGPTQVPIENGWGHPRVSPVLSLSRILSHMSSSTFDWAVVRSLPTF